MKPVALVRYVRFGGYWMYLEHAGTNYHIHGDRFFLATYDYVIKALKDLSFDISVRILENEELFFDELRSRPQDAVLTEDDVSKIEEIMNKCRPAMLAEAEGKYLYEISAKRVDVKRALEAPSELLAPGVYDVLSDVSRYDFSEAAKSIAFERPTAAAFHILRCVEGVLNDFYCFYVKRNRLAKPMWGPMVQQLRTKNGSKPKQFILDNLDNIRNNYRNPTAHPNKIYEIQECQDLFNICVGCINGMMQDMKKI